MPNPAFLAASTSIGDLHVCGGRWERWGYRVSEGDLILKRYLAAQNPKNPGTCFTAAYRTPRRVRGSREPNHVLCWGESCDGWRHFDCIGLVEFCVDQVTEKKYGGEIWQWASPRNVLGAVRMNNSDPILDGDLVSQVRDGNYHHIGVLYLNEDGLALVAQAEETKVGVTTGTLYNPASWSGGRWRLPDSILRSDGQSTMDLADAEFRPRLSVPSAELPVPGRGWQTAF